MTSAAQSAHGAEHSTSPETPSEPQVRCVWQGRVEELAGLKERPDLFARCAQRYAALGFGSLDPAEVRSWRRSWPPLVDALLRAGLGRMQIYLEYETAGGAGRFDALLLGRTMDGMPALVVVELKQWSGTQVISEHIVRLPDGTERRHPAVQVASYLAFLRDWFEAGSARVAVRGLAYLHNASDVDVERLRRARRPDARTIPLLGKADLAAGVPRPSLAERLLAADLMAPDARHVAGFARTRWEPSRKLLDSVADIFEGSSSFTLVGDQQDAFLRILHAVDEARRHHRRVFVAVTGGPGSGKTVIAVRLLARLCRRPELKPRYISPSGTLRAQLSQAAVRAGSADLFLLATETLTHLKRGCRMAILDEAQRLRSDHDQRLLRQIMERIGALVLFLDERQIIRPNEGVTVEEIEALASEYGAAVSHVSLSGCFRCNGSRAYADWVDDLLYGTPGPWTNAGFDLGVADDPVVLQSWIDHHTAGGERARIAAGFCWPWERRRGVLPPEVSIRWSDPHGRQHLWEAPWNAYEAINGDDPAPGRNFWATAPGGHRQIGCIYTAQGLEYEYGGVIFGPDLVRRGGAWQARPEHSHDRDLKDLPPHAYLPLALNIYRVLLTRGTCAMRVYSTDPETQRFLTGLCGNP